MERNNAEGMQMEARAGIGERSRKCDQIPRHESDTLCSFWERDFKEQVLMNLVPLNFFFFFNRYTIVTGNFFSNYCRILKDRGGILFHFLYQLRTYQVGLFLNFWSSLLLDISKVKCLVMHLVVQQVLVERNYFPGLHWRDNSLVLGAQHQELRV